MNGAFGWFLAAACAAISALMPPHNGWWHYWDIACWCLCGFEFAAGVFGLLERP